MNSIELAKDPDTFSEVLHSLVYHEDSLVRLYVAKNPNISAETLELLCENNPAWLHLLWSASRHIRAPKHIKLFYYYEYFPHQEFLI